MCSNQLSYRGLFSLFSFFAKRENILSLTQAIPLLHEIKARGLELQPCLRDGKCIFLPFLCKLRWNDFLKKMKINSHTGPAIACKMRNKQIDLCCRTPCGRPLLHQQFLFFVIMISVETQLAVRCLSEMRFLQRSFFCPPVKAQ